MKKITDFVRDHGPMLMGIGFAMILGAVLIMVNHSNRTGTMRTVALSVAALGGACYIAGRISVALGRRRAKPDEDEDSL